MDRKDLEDIIGPVDNQLAAEIAGIGANEQELAEAFAWLNADEAMFNAGRPMPSGRVARLIEILQTPDDEHP
ncbi:hypothetical protein [Pelagibacterium montanilacus]|uniref:hypothetical protein n=1 Tax=Pelagibacterium montanilacus TaxID=2185280 RepID=UPI000F8E4727|nr:hypothetical protein [Pelagibacterium montanilacus]